MRVSSLCRVVAVCLFSTGWFLGANAAENGGGIRIDCSYPEQSALFRDGMVYPDFVLNMSDTAGWKSFGSTGGHLLKAVPAPWPDNPNRKGVLFSCRLDTKNPKAPGWVGWQYHLEPPIGIVGADEVEIDIYPFQKYEFPITARFGSQKGFGQLPCTWSDITLQLEPNCWNTVRIPLKKSRKTTDTLRFDFNSRNQNVPHLVEHKMLIGAIRFVPTPEQRLDVPTEKLKTTLPVVAGVLRNPGPSELADGDKMTLQLDLAVESPREAELLCGTSRKMVELRPPFTVIRVEFDNPVELFGEGVCKLEPRILDGRSGAVLALPQKPFEVEFFSKQKTEERRLALLARLAGLEKEHIELSASGIQAELPGITLTTARLFLDHFIPDDFDRQRKFRIAVGELGDVATMLDRVDAELSAYRSKRLAEEPVTPYDPTLPLVWKSGVIRQNGKPILLIGPLTGIPASDWSTCAPRLGFNTVVVETNMDDWLNFESRQNKRISAKSDLFLRPSKFADCEELLAAYLENCRRNGLAANLLLSSHYCKTLPPDLQGARTPSATNGNFNWNVLAPEAKEAFRRMYSAIIPRLKDKPFLVSLGTANEPGYQVTAESVDFQREFRPWLKEKYGTVANLNTAWSSRFASFDDIDLKTVFNLGRQSSGAKVDWETFMSLKVSEFYGFLQGTLLASLPEKQVWVKLMHGIGYQMLDEQNNIRLGQNVSGTDGGEAMWMDHLRSLFPNLPVVNPEWHFLRDGYTSNAAYLAQRMFQGVARGIQSACIWRGARADWDSPGYGHSQSFSRYPNGLEAVGRTSCRMRMLYPVLVPFQQLDGGSVRIYYDKRAHLIRGDEYLKPLEAVYEFLRINPHGVRFLYPERLDDLKGIRMVAAGTLQDIPRRSAERLEKWVADGGTLWLTAPAAWSDYYGKKPALSGEFGRALATPGTTRCGKGEVIVDADWKGYVKFFSGPVAWGESAPDLQVECRLASGCLSIVNLSGDSRKVRLKDEEKEFHGTGRDLWNQADIDLGREMELTPFEVKLIHLHP